MRVPDRLEPLLAFGVIDEVLRPLMSGKEAEVYLVRSEGEERVAKVYKNAQHRSFQARSEYTEGRRVRSSREQRAMNKRSRHGKAKTEEAWRAAEADIIGRLRAADVRVPEPFAFTEGVLVMELVKGEDGGPAPRLVDVQFTRPEAMATFHVLVREVVKMLCAGVVHADLSDFNVLMSPAGPVIIDFPQAVDPARNRNARKLLLRDVKNLTSFLGRFAPELRSTEYGPEMWDLYERSELTPDSELTGIHRPSEQKAEVKSLLDEILHLEQEARERRERLGLPPPRSARRPVVFEEPKPKPKPKKVKDDAPAKGEGAPKRRRRRGRGESDAPPVEAQPKAERGSPEADPSDAPKKRRRRRRRGPKPEGAPPAAQASSAPPKPPKPPAEASPGGDRPARKRRRRRRGRGKPAAAPEGTAG